MDGLVRHVMSFILFPKTYIGCFEGFQAWYGTDPSQILLSALWGVVQSGLHRRQSNGIGGPCNGPQGIGWESKQRPASHQEVVSFPCKHRLGGNSPSSAPTERSKGLGSSQCLALSSQTQWAHDCLVLDISDEGSEHLMRQRGRGGDGGGYLCTIAISCYWEWDISLKGLCSPKIVSLSKWKTVNAHHSESSFWTQKSF